MSHPRGSFREEELEVSPRPVGKILFESPARDSLDPDSGEGGDQFAKQLLGFRAFAKAYIVWVS
jgi:hypothetical protein